MWIVCVAANGSAVGLVTVLQVMPRAAFLQLLNLSGESVSRQPVTMHQVSDRRY